MANDFMQAVLELQKNMPALQKDAINPHFGNSYVTLGNLLDKILPVLHEHGFILIQQVSTLDGKPALETILHYVETGDSLHDKMYLMLDRDNPQGQGSALTYARRYALMTVLGLTADEDDDAEEASKAPKVQRRARGRVVTAPEPPAPNEAANFS